MSQPTTGNVVLFEGARLITGNGGPPIENAAFIVENRRFTTIGRKGEVRPPSGAVRVDLTGKTVMPALVELHAHLGYWKGLSNTVKNLRERTSSITWNVSRITASQRS